MVQTSLVETRGYYFRMCNALQIPWTSSAKGRACVRAYRPDPNRAFFTRPSNSRPDTSHKGRELEASGHVLLTRFGPFGRGHAFHLRRAQCTAHCISSWMHFCSNTFRVPLLCGARNGQALRGRSPPNHATAPLPALVVVSTLQTPLGKPLCEALPTPAWEGCQGAKEAFLSRGTSVPLSPHNTNFPRL